MGISYLGSFNFLLSVLIKYNSKAKMELKSPNMLSYQQLH